MSSGKPILTNGDGEISQIINESRCGLTANSGDYKTLSKNMVKLSRLSQLEIKLMGENAKKYYENNFNREKILSGLKKRFEKTIIT